MTDKPDPIRDGVEALRGLLEDQFAEDIAIWLRVHVDASWGRDSEAVRSLAQRLIRVTLGASLGDE
jgi:hypothetical protein